MKCFWWIHIVIALVLKLTASKYVCPRQCKCELAEGLKKASCLNYNLVDINLGIPKYVQIIDVSYNSFSQIEDKIFKNLEFKSLTDLNLSHNLIYWIGLHAFEGLDNLTTLDLSYNRLERINADSFEYNKKLEVLDLSGNKFLNFRNEPFINHSQLKRLNLGESRISFLPDKSFSKLPSLTELDLSDNYMIQLQIKTLKPISELNHLSLDRNQWQCNDVMKNLQIWLVQSSIKFKPQCRFSNYSNTNKFEKIILLEKPIDDSEIRDIDELWNITHETSTEMIGVIEIDDENKSFIQMYNEKVPPIFSLVVGFELGIVLGILGTYCWMANLHKFNIFKFSRIRYNQNRRENRRNEGRARLLMNASLDENCVTTPPTARRQPAPAICRSYSWQPTGFNNRMTPSTTASTTRAETPPPGYNEALNDVVLSC